MPGRKGWQSLCFVVLGVMVCQTPYKEEKVEVEVGGFLTTEVGGGVTIILKEKNVENPRFLPITIGSCEALSINEYLSGEKMPRPLTYTLFNNILTKMNTQVVEVVVSHLVGGTYYARIVFKNGDRIWWEDSRPSDAINIALRANAPIYVMSDLLVTFKDEKNIKK